jgi:hypothetical protein
MTTRGVTSLVLLTLVCTGCLMDTEETYGEYPEEQMTGVRGAPLQVQARCRAASPHDGQDHAPLGPKDRAWDSSHSCLAAPAKNGMVDNTDHGQESFCPFRAWGATSRASPGHHSDPTPEPAGPAVIPTSSDSPPE